MRLTDAGLNPIPLICNGSKITASPQNPININDCFYGDPRLTFSFLVKNPILEENIVITDLERPIASEATQLSIYPNPNRGMCRVSFSLPTSKAAILEVRDLSARLMLTQNLQVAAERRGIATLDLSNYPSGMYLVRVRTEQGILTRKIIKQ